VAPLIRLTGIKNFNFSGWPAIIIVHLYSFYPLTFLFVNNFLKTIDNSSIEAARVLGSKKFATFYYILLPQLKPPLVAASILTLMTSMASFSAPFIFGGSRRFLTTEIYYAKINGDTSLSALLSILLVLTSLICLVLFRQYNKKIPVAPVTKGVTRRVTSSRKGRFDIAHSIFVAVFALIILLPVLSLIFMSLIPDSAVMQTGAAFNFSFANYRSFFSNSDFFAPFTNSTKAGLLAVLVTVLVALAAAHIVRRKNNSFTSFIDISALLPYGIPGTVLGICMILTFNTPSVFSFYNVLIGSFWILPIVYSIRNLPIAVEAIKTSLHTIDKSGEEASATMGAGYFHTWRSITLPLLYPSILEATMLIFINAFGEFVATVLLYTYSSKTVPIEIYSQIRGYNNGLAAAYGVIIFLIVLCFISSIKTINHRIFLKRYGSIPNR